MNDCSWTYLHFMSPQSWKIGLNVNTQSNTLSRHLPMFTWLINTQVLSNINKHKRSFGKTCMSNPRWLFVRISPATCLLKHSNKYSPTRCCLFSCLPSFPSQESVSILMFAHYHYSYLTNWKLALRGCDRAIKHLYSCFHLLLVPHRWMGIPSTHRSFYHLTINGVVGACTNTEGKGREFTWTCHQFHTYCQFDVNWWWQPPIVYFPCSYLCSNNNKGSSQN